MILSVVGGGARAGQYSTPTRTREGRARLACARSWRGSPDDTDCPGSPGLRCRIDALDTALDAGGELRTLRGQAWQERQARRIGLPDPRKGRGEDATDRREIFELAAAGVLARLGAGDEAEPIARAALTQTHGLGFEDQGHALLGLAIALATRTRPAPDEAAAVAARAVALLADRPTFSVTVKAREVAAGLAPWHEVSEVRDYCEQVRALPPGGSV